MKTWPLAAMVVACGGGDSATSDAPGSDDAPSVPQDAAPACDLSKPFNQPEQVRYVNTSSSDRWGWLSPDQLTIYFSSQASGGGDRNVYAATRSFPGGLFVSAAPLDGVNTSMYSEERPTLTADGLEMFIEAGSVEIHHATRASTADPFSLHTAVINDGGVDRNPWISEDGLTLYFSSNRSGNPDLYRTTRASRTSVFDPAAPISELNTMTDEFAPVLSSDGLELYFGKYLGLGDTGIYRATRPSPTAPFEGAAAVAELAANGENFPSWISPDRCTLIFTSTRAGGQGSWDIWIATRGH